MSSAGAATKAADCLRAVLDLADPVGVLSIYVDADPGLAGGVRPAWQAPVRDGLRGLVKEAREEDWLRQSRIALEERLEQLEPELETLLDPRESSRTRVLFASISSPEQVRVELRTPIAPLVAFGAEARALPLVATLREGRAAGVVLLDRERVAVSEWELDELEPLDSIELTEADPEQRGSPGRTNPAARQSSPERDRFERGFDARLAVEVRALGERLRRLASERGWELVVADGDGRLLAELRPSFPDGGGCRLAEAEAPLAALPDAELAVRIGELVRREREQEAARLSELLDASPLVTRGGGAVAVALDQGRVERVVLDPSLPPVVAERLLRRALATSAAVTVAPTPDEAVALLRW